MEMVDVAQKPTLLGLRNELGISQSAVSKALGISQALYSKIERGEKQVSEDKIKEITEKIKSLSSKDKEAEENKVSKKSDKKVKKEKTEKKRGGRKKQVEEKSQYKCPLLDILKEKDNKISELEKLISEIRASISQLKL